MKIGFFGTPEIARTCLDRLCQKHNVLFVVSSEDKPAGRKLRLRSCPAKELACCLSIPVYHPDNLKDPSFIETLENYDADIFVVVAFGRIIPREVFDIPPLKTINLHPSLLPLYRGAAPIEWALINGEKKTGITVQLINERLDAGDILLQREIPVDVNMNAGDLYSIVKDIGPDLLDETIQGLHDGSIVPRPQDENMATFCGKIDNNTLSIKWSRPAESIHNLVRGLSPGRGARTSFRGKIIKIYRTVLSGECSEIPGLQPGEITVFRKKRLFAGTAGQPLEIISLQPETGRIMDALQFINGQRIKPGDLFE